MKNNMDEKLHGLENELAEYQRMALSYGITAPIMLSLAKSQIKTVADSIRVREVLTDLYRILGSFRHTNRGDLLNALAVYDGDGSKAYCDLVWEGLDLIRSCEDMCRKIEEVL